MAAPTITYDPLPEGYRVYKHRAPGFDGFLIAVLKCNHDAGHTKDVRVNNDTVKVKDWKPMPAEGRSIHWTSGEVSLEDVKAVVASLPEGL